MGQMIVDKVVQLLSEGGIPAEAAFPGERITRISEGFSKLPRGCSSSRAIRATGASVAVEVKEASTELLTSG